MSDRHCGDEGDRLISLADALSLVPFSETTLRRAIAKGELEAWQPSRDGKLVMWRSTLFAWVTRRPARGEEQANDRAERRPARSSSRRRPRRSGASQVPPPITLPEPS